MKNQRTPHPLPATPIRALISATAISITCAALTLGCDGDPPKRAQLELPEFVLSADPIKALVWTWDERNTRTPASGKLNYTLEPAELASVDSSGLLTCKQSGDGKLSVSVRGVETTGLLRCRLVDRIEAHDLGRIDLNSGPVKLDVGAYDKAGERLSDVPLLITTPNAKVARASGSELVPVAVGEAKVAVRAGNVEKQFDVQVVRKLEPEALPIDDNKRIHFSLDAGKYELVVELADEKKLSVEWRGGPHCNYSGVAQKHTSECVLRAKGGAVFDNPAYLNTGAKTVSHEGITLHEVP